MAGGIAKLIPYISSSGTYNLASLGTGPERTGMIKSLDASGNWDGVIYLVPFHAAVALKQLVAPSKVALTSGKKIFQAVEMPPSSTVEFYFRGAASKEGKLRLIPVVNDTRLPEQAVDVIVNSGKETYRINYRFPLKAESVTFEVALDSAIEAEDFTVTLFNDQAAQILDGKFKGERHRGGATFAVIPDLN